MDLEHLPEKHSCSPIRSEAGRVSLFLLYLHAEVKAHSARPESIIHSMHIRGYWEKRHGERKSNKSSRNKLNMAQRFKMGKKVVSISFGKKPKQYL